MLRDTGLDWAHKIGVLTLVGGYVLYSAVLSQDLAAALAAELRHVAAWTAHCC
jgi:hypothetical protein